MDTKTIAKARKLIEFQYRLEGHKFAEQGTYASADLFHAPTWKAVHISMKLVADYTLEGATEIDVRVQGCDYATDPEHWIDEIYAYWFTESGRMTDQRKRVKQFKAAEKHFFGGA